MKLEYHKSITTLPFQAVLDLYRADTAERAEMVFHAWRDKGVIVPALNRADVWDEAKIAFDLKRVMK